MPGIVSLHIGEHKLDLLNTLEARIAGAVLVATLLRPKSKEYRTRRRLAFLNKEKELLRASGEWEDLPTDLRKAINREFKSKTMRIAKPVSNYLPNPKTAKATDEIRDIFTVGLMPMVLEEIHSRAPRKIGPCRYDTDYRARSFRATAHPR